MQRRKKIAEETIDSEIEECGHEDSVFVLEIAEVISSLVVFLGTHLWQAYWRFYHLHSLILIRSRGASQGPLIGERLAKWMWHKSGWGMDSKRVTTMMLRFLCESDVISENCCWRASETGEICVRTEEDVAAWWGLRRKTMGEQCFELAVC